MKKKIILLHLPQERTCDRERPSLRTLLMASAMVSGRQDLRGPRSLKRRFWSRDCVWFQDFCQAACTCAWYESVGTEEKKRVKLNSS